ncbi:hypothetical protein IJO12_02095 [bacterium]|nr:hypothetical protein [bacterium]
MANQINTNIFTKFVIEKIGNDKILTKDEAKDLQIDESAILEADVDENEYLDLDEILDNETLYEQFAVMYNNEYEADDDKGAKENEEKKGQKVEKKENAKN